MIPQPTSTRSFLEAVLPHLHIVSDTCPWCEQQIPQDKLEEISGKIATKERERTLEITAELEQQYETNLAQVEAKARADLEFERRQSAAKETAAREEARKAAEAAAEEKKAEIAKIKADAAADAVRIRQEESDAAESRVRDKLAEKEKAVAETQEKLADAEGRLSTVTQQHELDVAERLSSQRDILEKAKADAVNAERAKAFEENQKLSGKVDELQRALEKKTAEELGEGAEVDLFEDLKKEFQNDRIERVAKGSPGADIHHVVIHNGKECGTIIYDAKNHKAFRNEFVTKLAADQLSAKAEHAILSTHKFPSGTRQLHIQDGVLLANPARVVAIVKLIRQHMLQVHSLRLSSAEREDKTAALYDFITSERCSQLLTRIDTLAEDLLDQQVKEKKRHDAAWKKEGELIRGIQKAQG